MSRTVAFRCYTGPGVGMGHLVRCRELARLLQARGDRAVIMGPGLDLKVPQDDALFDRWLPQDGTFDADHDAAQFIDLCASVGARHAVLDDYRMIPAYQAHVRAAGLRWMQQFDASKPFAFDADILVNSGPYEQQSHYADYLVNPDARVLFGPRYAVLRPAFQNVAPHVPSDHVARILISFGGGDDHGALGLCADALGDIVADGATLVMISGGGNPANARYRDRFATVPGVEFHVAPPDLPELMAGCDLALIAGGTMSYEAAFCGVPFALISQAANQARSCKGWTLRTGAVFLGTVDQVGKSLIAQTVQRLIDDPEKRADISARGRAEVDGHGGDRLLDALFACDATERTSH